MLAAQKASSRTISVVIYDAPVADEKLAREFDELSSNKLTFRLGCKYPTVVYIHKTGPVSI